ncbi:hypothetical protein G6F65_016155 [Rhizopus arrhizus]|nr:hypothetical protein G6F65_016155 [Rhizopus arrhizus]
MFAAAADGLAWLASCPGNHALASPWRVALALAYWSSVSISLCWVAALKAARSTRYGWVPGAVGFLPWAPAAAAPGLAGATMGAWSLAGGGGGTSSSADMR